MSWFPHQLALLLSFISTCFIMLRCCQWSTNIPLFYFQIPLNCSSKGADCICCTFSLHTVPLFVWFDFASVSIIIAHKTIQFLIFFFQMEDRVKESNYMLQEKSENEHTCNLTTTSMTASTTTGICQRDDAWRLWSDNGFHLLCYEFYKIARNMRNVAFTPKGDHIAWTQVEQFTSKSTCTSFPFFAEVWYLYTRC